MKIFFIISSIFLVLPFLLGDKKFFIVNTSASTPIGIYRVKYNQTPSLGDYVVFSSSILSQNEFPNLPQRIIKEVRGIPGDTIFSSDETILIRGISYDLNPRVKTRTCPLGVIPKGYFFLATDHPLSLDSRYFGLVPSRELQYLQRRKKDARNYF